jgi:hypothetical protein
MLFVILLSLQVLDKVINFMPETDDVSDDERCKEDDDDSGINFKFQKIEERGLSELVRQCFGKALNKSEQMSDWERRPLRQQQILYAGIYNLCINCFHLLARKPNLEKSSIYSKKFSHNVHLSESNFTCPWLGASGIV